ncbi:hypothetical protein KPL70_001805 [Citrus sinensis]|nr:hypothetical protein KPL70_001805 [Citrus sinensis]
MKLCEEGELVDRIVAKGHYTERVAAAVMKTIVEVVQVEVMLYVFSDLILLTCISLYDFSTAGEQFNEIVGSLYYMALEVLKRNYGPEVDVWKQRKVLWSILGANSIVQVGNDDNVSCLGFVDGGAPRTSIVIGGYQLENNLLQFDLASSRLAIELAFKSFLNKARAAMDKSDPARDPDDIVDQNNDDGADGNDKDKDKPSDA